MTHFILEILSFVMIVPAIIGAYLMSNEQPSRRYVFISNGLYTITNAFSLVFMIWNFHVGYFVLYVVYLCICIRGLWLNRPKKDD